MKRRGSHRPAITIALFPFLAVLICTMGVIIVMLVLVVQQATKRAHEEVAQAAAWTAKTKTVAASQSAENERQQKEAFEDLEWQQETLTQQREARRAELTKLREQLGHVEDHLRRLQGQARQLLSQAQNIDSGKKLGDDELQAAQRELEKTKALIAKAQQEQEELKKKLQASQRWFALIPYDGPNGTRRRPIYIECSEAGIVLQPEGLALMPDDFNGPLGPGNPLDAVLRAKREHMERGGEMGLPYPLLIVRPDGIVAYMAARSALKSWDEEFGYELIDADKKLTYGQADPAFAQTLAGVVRQARRRQAALAAAMPRKFSQADSLTSFRTSEALGDAPEMSLAAGRGVGVGGGSRPIGGGTGTRTGSPTGVGAGGTGSGGLGTGAAANFGPPTGTAGNGTNTTGQRLASGSQPLRNNSTTAASQTATAVPNGLRGSSSSGGGTTGGVAGGPNAIGNSSGASGGTSIAADPSGQSAAGSANNAKGSTTASSSPPQDSSSASGTPSVTMNASATQKPPVKRYGQNWGLPNAAGRSVAVTRPIRVTCLPDRIVVYPEKGDVAQPSQVRLHEYDIAPQEVDAFVAAVQKQIQGWGIAAQNGYWKPILTVEVPPEAAARFDQLETALRGSGYDVQRKVR